MAGLGTLVNVAAIVGGTLVGLLLGGRLPDRVRTTVLQGVGLAVVALGLGNALQTDNLVFPLVAVVAGGIVGELLEVEDRLERTGRRIRDRVERGRDAGDAPSTFVEGFVAATLLFCVGPLAILGSLDDGLNGDIDVLVVKAALDGLVSVVFASTLGLGVGFSALSVALYQGGLTALAGTADGVLTDRMITELTAAGGLLIVGIGLRLLEITPVRVGSLLPALAIVPLLVAAFAR